ncbi:replication endonuclease [Pseudoalteromonas tunicata]|nr:replication endonuclease [Pseudoalteromonas tunicata]
MMTKPVDLDTLRLSGMAKGIIAAITDVDNFNFLARGLQTVPTPLQSRLARKYITRYNQQQKDARYKANRWLSRVIYRLKPRFNVLFRITQNMPLPWHILSSSEKTKNHGATMARECLQIALDISDDYQRLKYEKIAKLTYEACAELSKSVGVTAPFYSMVADYLPTEAIEIALLKMQCDKWWARQLKKVRRQYIELLEIATGEVGKDLFYCKKTKKYRRKGISPYSSKQAQREFSFAQASGRQFLEMMELESSNGDVISLIDAVKSGMANPTNRRNELMLRIRETEELADEMGYVGMFYTITCPARFHANADKWDGSTPKDAQAYLIKEWARIRTKLNNRGLNYFGVRVVEPHADGCPHWHMMLFMPANKAQEINAIMRWYFIKEDKNELYARYKNGERSKLFKQYKQKRQEWGFAKSQGKKVKAPTKFYRTFSPRFDVVKMDKTKGSAASYIAKYISKNIDGYQLTGHEDAETGESLDQQVNPVLAWATTWNIRQFQFQGSPSVTVYRELRRERKELADETIEQIREAADRGCWFDYVKLQGGMCIGRNANFKPLYEDTPFGNNYAEVVRRIKGIKTNVCEKALEVRSLLNVFSVHVATELKTRLVEWTRQIAGTAEKTKAAAEGGAFVGVADLSWTSGNNCTPIAAGSRAQFDLLRHGLTKNQIDDLKTGKRIAVDDRIYQLKNGELVILEGQSALNEQKRLATEYQANTFAQKAGRLEPNKEDWRLARELIALAYSHAANAGRDYLVFGRKDERGELIEQGDYEYAQAVMAGDVEQDWWDTGLMMA